MIPLRRKKKIRSKLENFEMLVPLIPLDLTDDSSFPSVEYVRRLGICGPVFLHLEWNEVTLLEYSKRIVERLDVLKQYFRVTDCVVGGIKLENEEDIEVVMRLLNNYANFIVINCVSESFVHPCVGYKFMAFHAKSHICLLIYL